MGTPDLCVDGRLLARVHDALVDLRVEFDALGDSERDLSGDWGSRDVQDAIDDFVGNWDDNRRRIATNLRSTADMASTCIARFDEVEQALAEGISS